MFVNEDLKNHLETSSSVRINSRVTAEWNLNNPSNIYQIGNYRYRPTDPDSPYYLPISSFDPKDAQNDINFYTDATYSDIVIDGGIDVDDSPVAFVKRQEKERQLYSLEDCFGRNRPRSGINKLRFFKDNYTHFPNRQMSNRPRYYASSRNDTFKYWTSYRKEVVDGVAIERGVANLGNSAGFGTSYIDDACPYVVYKDALPANRIIIKMQTNVGDVNLGPFTTASQTLEDPFYGEQNATVPTRWRVQVLNKNSAWVDAIGFDENSTRSDGSSIVGNDGYVELQYGALIPPRHKANFVLLGEYSDESLLPSPLTLIDGNAYFIKNKVSGQGNFYIVKSGQYETVSAQYSWFLGEPQESSTTPYATTLVNPPTVIDGSSNTERYTELQYIYGIRVVVEKMNKFDCTFDLIELSPRLAVDLSDKTEGFSITKNASDLGVSGMPVSQLLASTGSLNLFDYDQAFFSSNTESIINPFLSQKIQFKFSEIIKDVNGKDVVVPLKTLYSDMFPQANSLDRSVSIDMRDLFYYFEQQAAPQILDTGVTTSYAISMLLDSIGFSNYKFYGLDNDTELEIPFFFIAPDKTVAEVLNDIATSTQSAMFFDEDNNFIVMSKNYMLPSSADRETDLVLRGTKDFEQAAQLKNSPTNLSLANIENIASQDRQIFNAGTISYTARHIQRSYGSIKQASMLDRDKTWTYKPALLWEVSPTEQTKPINQEVSDQSAYVLGAIPLNSDLSATEPAVENNVIVNNVIDLGDGIYWITRYNSYLYANGEVIKYDAVQFSVPGLSATTDDPNVEGDNVWITSPQEYSRYFAQMPFGGKMYPTGLVRIFVEPNFETASGVTRFKNGPVLKHGRAQFGTTIVAHPAGISSYWSSNENVRGCKMDFLYLSNGSTELPATEVGAAGINHSRAKDTTRQGRIKNFLANANIEDGDQDSSYPGMVQASALVFNGTSFSYSENPLEHISYVYKPLTDKFTHFGTRMRIIGKMENNEIRGQTPVGSFTYYTPSETSSSQPAALAGASGGIAVSVNPETNVGYYFEIAALTDLDLEKYPNNSVKNLLFYKVKKQSGAEDADKAVPIPLWSGIGQILVDDGKFTGQSRMATSDTNTVYDLSVEYQDIGAYRRFYLFINNDMVAIVDDRDPLPLYNNMALFVRGSSECMFENVYALADTQIQDDSKEPESFTVNYSEDKTFSIVEFDSGTSSGVEPLSSSPQIAAFGVDQINANESFQKYALSGIIQSTYLATIGATDTPRYSIFFEEFGTIMREAAYFNIRYDKAYPALYAKLSPTFNKQKSYTVSNFFASSYGAEFLVFNSTDTALSLDSTSGNYLRIQGVTFTQQSTDELTVDKYFDQQSNEYLLKLDADSTVKSSATIDQEYFAIKRSRVENGEKSFALNATYIQNQEDAEELMGWMVDKMMKPAKSVGVEIFAIPTLQLGDVVEIDYKNNQGRNEVSPEGTRFVVYSIDYTRDSQGPTMMVYLSEVT